MALGKAKRRWLENRFGERVAFDEPMHKHTSFRIGGPADALVVPREEAELVELLNWIRHENLSWIVVGKGTNLLVKDQGIRGIVIAMTTAFDKIKKETASDGAIRLRVSAGARLQSCCRLALKNGLAGMNFALGIPGTVGGALKMNAGTAKGAMESVVEELAVLQPDATVTTLKKNQLAFSYRKLAWQDLPEPILLRAAIRLHPGNPDAIRKEADDLLKLRRSSQPTRKASAGCFFRNPSGGQAAGKLIEDAGLKGLSVGEAQISPKHANYLVNKGDATASDVLALMEIVQEKVSKRFHILLEPEVTIVG